MKTEKVVLLYEAGSKIVCNGGRVFQYTKKGNKNVEKLIHDFGVNKLAKILKKIEILHDTLSGVIVKVKTYKTELDVDKFTIGEAYDEENLSTPTYNRKR